MKVRPTTRLFTLALLVIAAAATGCGAPTGEGPAARFVETGDLDRIRSQRTVRILVPSRRSWTETAPTFDPLAFEQALIADWARGESLEVDWVEVDSRDRLIPLLLAGHGDIVAANMTATPARRARVSFTVPFDFVREQIVTRTGDITIRAPEDLVGRSIGVRRSSSFWSTLVELKDEFPGIALQEIDETVETPELIDRVAHRRLDLTVADSNLLESVLAQREDVRIGCDLTRERPLAWAVRPDSHKLVRSLNRFLDGPRAKTRYRGMRTGDLEEIRKRKVLRVLTRTSASTYFLWRGELMGFEYELTREFAERHGLRVEVVVPPRSEDLVEWLMQGRGDVVAAALTPSERHTRQGVAFSRPYNFVSAVMVGRADEQGLDSLESVAGREVHVRRGSTFWRQLHELRERRGLDFDIVATPSNLEAEEVIGRVAESRYDLTVAHSHVLDIEMTWHRNVSPAFELGEPVPLAWAVRERNPALLAAIDEFLQREYRGLFYNVIYRRYFEDPRKIRRHQEDRFTSSGSLSPWDPTVMRYAKLYDFDWRLIVAMMYQESRFDPKARSFAGARGLMQVLPRTAAEMGLPDVDDPEENIHAGVKYLAWLRDRFPEDIDPTDRMWFVLASYNAGHEHVRDARRLAVEKGWDPNRWFDNVETAIGLLSRSEYARKARYGYCRGSEPIKYVREIALRFAAYREATSRGVKSPQNVSAKKRSAKT